MAPADDVDAAAKASPLWAKYGEPADAQSARELLAGRLAEPAPSPSRTCARRWSTCRRRARAAAPRRPATAGADAIGDFLRSREGKALQRKLTRGIFGMLRKRI